MPGGINVYAAEADEFPGYLRLYYSGWIAVFSMGTNTYLSTTKNAQGLFWVILASVLLVGVAYLFGFVWGWFLSMYTEVNKDRAKKSIYPKHWLFPFFGMIPMFAPYSLLEQIEKNFAKNSFDYNGYTILVLVLTLLSIIISAYMVDVKIEIINQEIPD